MSFPPLHAAPPPATAAGLPYRDMADAYQDACDVSFAHGLLSMRTWFRQSLAGQLSLGTLTYGASIGQSASPIFHRCAILPLQFDCIWLLGFENIIHEESSPCLARHFFLDLHH